MGEFYEKLPNNIEKREDKESLKWFWSGSSFEFFPNLIAKEQQLRVMRADRAKLERWAKQLQCSNAPTIPQPPLINDGPIPFPSAAQESLCAPKRELLSTVDATIVKIYKTPEAFKGYINDLHIDSPRDRDATNLRSLSHFLNTLVIQHGDLIITLRNLGCSFHAPIRVDPTTTIGGICQPLVAKIDFNRQQFRELNALFTDTSLSVSKRKAIGARLHKLDEEYTSLRVDSDRYHCDLWKLGDQLLNPTVPK